MAFLYQCAMFMNGMERLSQNIELVARFLSPWRSSPRVNVDTVAEIETTLSENTIVWPRKNDEHSECSSWDYRLMGYGSRVVAIVGMDTHTETCQHGAPHPNGGRLCAATGFPGTTWLSGLI
jgi:hypothetical protein